jgi:hypothetical protein
MYALRVSKTRQDKCIKTSMEREHFPRPEGICENRWKMRMMAVSRLTRDRRQLTKTRCQTYGDFAETVAFGFCEVFCGLFLKPMWFRSTQGNREQ